MAIVHNTTLVPSKVELLAVWLPEQPWYRGTGTPEITRTGGFRLDDPAGEVGIEFLVVTDTASPGVAGYLVPLTYRSDPIDATPVGTMEHGVLGTRYAYDGPSDPVFRAGLAALVRGEAEPQAQTASDTPDPTVLVGPAPAGDVELVRVLTASDATPGPGEVSVRWRLLDGSEVRGLVTRQRS